MAEDNVLGIQATINGDEIQKGATNFINKINEMERAADRASDSMADSFQFLDRQIQQLSSSLEANRQKLESIFSQMQSFKPTNSISTEAYTKLQDEYAKAMGMQQQLEGQLSKATAENNDQRQAYERLTAEIRENGKEVVSASMPKSNSSISNAKELKEQFKQIGAEIKKNEKLYEQQTQKLSEYEAKITRYQEAQAKGTTRIGIGGAKSELVEPALQKAIQEYEELRQEQTSVTGEIDKQKQKQQELNAQIEQANPKVVRFRTELMNIKQQMMDMKRNGQANTEEFSKLQQKAAELQRTMNVTNKQTQLMASPKLGFQATREGVTLLTGTLTGATAIMSMFNSKSEDVAKMQKRLQEVMAITMAVQQLFSVSLATSALRTYALGKAKLFLTTTTNGLRTAFVSMGLSATGASIAVTALYAALTLGISAAIIAIVSAISVWASKNNELKKNLENIAKENFNVQTQMRKDTASGAGSQLALLKKLQMQWTNFGVNLKKQKQFINDNQKSFKQLGISIKSVNDANNVFVNNTAKYIEALMNRARAAAYYKQVEADAERIAALEEDNSSYMARKYKKGDTFQKKITGKILGIIPDSTTVDIKLKTDELVAQAQKIENERARQAHEEKKKKNNTEIDRLTKRMTDNLNNFINFDTQANTLLTKSKGKEESQTEKLRQQEKYNLLMNKQALEQSRAAEDLQNKVIQSGIDTMVDGNAKTIAQMRLNHKKEQQELEWEKEDTLRKKIEDAKAIFDAQEKTNANKDKDYKKKTFDGSNITLSRDEDYAFRQRKMNLDLKQFGEEQSPIDTARKAWDNYIIEYGTFQEKKEAIAREYADKIRLATTDGEKASLKKEFETKDKELNLDEIKSSINFADIFGNLDAQSTDAIKTLRDKLKEIIEKSAKDLKPSDLKALQEALQGMDLKIAERDTFSELKNGLDNYKESAKAVEQAQKDLNTVTSGGEVIIGSYIDSTGKITKKLLTQEQAEKNLTDAQRKKKESQMQLTQSVNSIGEKGQQVVSAGNDLVDMLTNLGIKIPESVTGALSGVGQIMDGLASIDITKPMSIVTGATKMLAGLGKTIGSIFGLGGDSNTKKHFEDLKEQLDGINKIYEKIIENSKEKITFGEGFAAITAAADAMDTLNKKLENYRSLVRAGIEYKDGSKKNAGWHSNKNVGAENFARMSKLVGKNITSVYDLANLEAEDLYTIMTKMPGAWGQMDEHVRTALEDIVACKDEAKELGDALGEAVTGVSFDSFYNGFIDQLADMEASSEEFADNFEGYLRKSIMASIVANNYKGQIEKLYNDWAKYGNDQIYSEDEIKDLRKQQEDITNAMLAERENLANTFGWENSSSSQEATKGVFQTMSQDTGTELNGRFTALQIAGEEIKNQAIQQTGLLQLISVDTSDISRQMSIQNQYVSEILDVQHESVGYLSEISKNTKQLYQMNERLGKIEQNTRGM